MLIKQPFALIGGFTIFQADIASAENPLPVEIKENILSLSVFIDKHTVGALAEPEGGKLKVLIEINRNIAAGLMTVPEEAVEPDLLKSEPPVTGGGVVA